MIIIPSWEFFISYQVLVFNVCILILPLFINYNIPSLILSLSFNPTVYFLNKTQQEK